MKKLLGIALIAVLAFLGWMFLTGQDDPEIKALTEDVTDVAKRIGDKAKTEAEAIRARVMDKNDVDLHSDSKPMNVEEPKIDDLKFHIWGNGKYGNAPYTAETTFPNSDANIFLIDDNYTYSFDTKLGASYKTHTSCQDMSENPNGAAFTSTMMNGCWNPIKIENDVIIMGFADIYVGRYERITGDQARTYQAEYDAWKAKQTN